MYCAFEDLRRLLGDRRLLELGEDTGKVSEARFQELLAALDDSGAERSAAENALLANLEEAIDAADREIDGWVSVVAPVPLADPPGIVANLSAKIAVYNLHRRRPHLELGEWKEEYERALKTLERIAQGRIPLAPATVDNPVRAEGPGVSVVSGEQEFGDDLRRRY